MKHKGTYLKALVLLVVFALNSAISTACSFSAMFHQLHHHRDSNEHEHANGERHSHEHNGTHHASDNGTPEDCCAKASVEFNQLDKSLAAGSSLQMPLLAVPEENLYRDILLQLNHTPGKVFHFTRWRPPGTIQRIRIAIQSFQV